MSFLVKSNCSTAQAQSSPPGFPQQHPRHLSSRLCGSLATAAFL